jgi:acyl carrier protein
MTQRPDVLQCLSRRLPHLAHLLVPDQSLRGLNLDSIDLVEMLCAVQSEFDVRLTEADLANAATVGNLAEVIESRRKEAMA